MGKVIFFFFLLFIINFIFLVLNLNKDGIEKIKI